MKWGDMMELKGAIVGIFEEYLDEKNIAIPNEERDTDRELDPDNAARIYGEDFDRIADPIEEAFVNAGMTVDEPDQNFQIAFPEGKIDRMVEEIYEGFMTVVEKSPQKDLYEEDKGNAYPMLSGLVQKEFMEWGLVLPPRDREYWKNFAEGLSFNEMQALRYELDRPNLVEDIKYAIDDGKGRDVGKKTAEWMQHYLETHTEAENDLLFDKIIEDYNWRADCEQSYWTNIGNAICSTVEAEKKREAETEPER